MRQTTLYSFSRDEGYTTGEEADGQVKGDKAKKQEMKRNSKHLMHERNDVPVSVWLLVHVVFLGQFKTLYAQNASAAKYSSHSRSAAIHPSHTHALPEISAINMM